MINQMRLDECCISISDGDHLPPPKSDCGVPFITISNIDPVNNSIDFSDTMTVPKKYYDSLLGIRKALVGDILYSVVGSFGIPVLIKENKEFVFQRHIAILRPNSKIVRPAYLYYIMKSKSFYAQADSYAIGSAQRTISLSSLRRMKVSIPSTDVQDQVIAALTAYDNLIEVNNKRIKVLEQMAENLYKEWFVRLRFPGHESVPFENGLPKGWKPCKLSELFDVRYGKEHKEIGDGQIPIFGSGGIMRYGDQALYAGESVLIPRKGTLNNIMYYNGPFWTVDTMFYTVLLKDDLAKYAYFTLKNVDMESYNSGAALPSMTTDILYHLKIIVPDDNTLEWFDRFIDGVFKQTEAVKKLNENLIRQRDLLLPRLMSGKLEV